MKKIIILFISFITFSFLIIEIKGKAQNSINNSNIEFKAVYISYLEYLTYFMGNSETIQKSYIDKMIDNVSSMGFNTIILHVSPFSDAIYRSKILPFSYTITGVESKNPGYDLLEYFIKKCKVKNIDIHAWINPFRISSKSDISLISKTNPAYELLNTNHVQVTSNGIYYNPSSEIVHDLIINIVEELILNYEIKGIHFDDYFYPNKTIDLTNYDEYLLNGGSSDINNYRLDVINRLIKDVYSTIKNINKDIIFGISPEGNIDNNYNNQYADIYTWLSSDGYIDYIMPQIYFGFLNQNKPFIETLYLWNDLIKNDVKLIPALAFYKVGVHDKYAFSGEYEWINNSNVIMKQIMISRNTNKYLGFSLFRYDYLFNDKLSTLTTNDEKNNILKIIHSI